MSKKLDTIAIVLSITAIALIAFVCATDKEKAFDSNTGNRRIEQGNPNIYSPKIPDKMDFCGENVPLDLYYVREALDRELIVNTFSHISTLLYFKRAHRYFPIIEPILKKNGVPDDFKYLCVIESGLTNATSPAKAQGFWQFIKATGQKYGLEINDEIDMRNNLEASTEAACQFLKTLRRNLGSWTAAAAAYNCGEAGLSNNMEKQSIDSYYNTRLNRETSRYIYRILAVKQIMKHPQEYGFFLRPSDLYPSIPTRTSTLSGHNVDIYAFAKNNGCSYKVFRELNPWITTEKLTNKTNKSYTVKLPIPDGLSLRKIRTDRDKGSDFITEM